MKAHILARWELVCARAGLLDLDNEKQLAAFRLHAVDVKGHCSTSDYLAKMDEARHWGADRELAKASSKEGRAKGLHPFAILANAAEGDKAAGALFVQYVKAMRRKSQLYWSSRRERSVLMTRPTRSWRRNRRTRPTPWATWNWKTGAPSGRPALRLRCLMRQSLGGGQRWWRSWSGLRLPLWRGWRRF